MIAIAAGLFALFRPGITGLALMVVIAAWAIARGAFEIIAAVRLPEKSAIVAEIEETWVIPVDTRMEAIGGLVIRRPRAGSLMSNEPGNSPHKGRRSTV